MLNSRHSSLSLRVRTLLVGFALASVTACSIVPNRDGESGSPSTFLSGAELETSLRQYADDRVAEIKNGKADFTKFYWLFDSTDSLRLKAGVYVLNQLSEEKRAQVLDSLLIKPERMGLFWMMANLTDSDWCIKGEFWKSFSAENAKEAARAVNVQSKISQDSRLQHRLIDLLEKVAVEDPAFILSYGEAIFQTPKGQTLLDQAVQREPFAFFKEQGDSLKWTGKYTAKDFEIKLWGEKLSEAKNVEYFWDSFDSIKHFLPKFDFAALRKKALEGLDLVVNGEDKISLKITAIDSMHELPKQDRFSLLNKETASSLFTMLAQADGYYPSSYAGIFEAFIRSTQKTGVSPVNLVIEQKDKRLVRNFITNLSSHGTMDALVRPLSSEESTVFIDKVFDVLEISLPVEGWSRLTEKGAVLADLAASIAKLGDEKIKNDFVRTLTLYYDKAQTDDSRKTLGLVMSRFAEVNKGEIGTPQGAAIAASYPLTHTPVLAESDLFQQGKHIAVVAFYNDDGDDINDGMNSYGNFMGELKKSRQWQVEDHGTYITAVKTNKDKQFLIFANKPKTSEQGYADIQSFLKEQGLHVDTVSERGHMYNLEIKHIPQQTPAYVLWGGCGGYNNTLFMMEHNPKAQMVVAREVGRGVNNNKIFFAFVDEVLNQPVLNLNEVMRKAYANGVPSGDYVAPDNNALHLIGAELMPKRNDNLPKEKQAAAAPS